MKAVSYAATICQASGQPNKARTYYLQWLADEPNNVRALNNLACLLAEDLKNPQEARAYSQKAYDLQRRSGYVDPMIQDTQGWVLTLCKGAAALDGLNLLDAVVHDHADFLEGRYHLGQAYLNQNRPAEALRQFEAAQLQIKAQEAKSQVVSPSVKDLIQKGLDQARQMTRIGQ